MMALKIYVELVADFYIFKRKKFDTLDKCNDKYKGG